MKMRTVLAALCFTAIFVSMAEARIRTNFWEDFYIKVGDTNVKYPALKEEDCGKEIDLGLDVASGSAFKSKYPFLFGHFSMKIKVPAGDTSGVVTSYFLASNRKKWCGVEFSFIGDATSEEYVIQTNVVTYGVGEREQRLKAWFNPTAAYHEYGFLWNEAYILFLIDDTVIRVFHNQENIGVPFPDYQPMYIQGRINNETLCSACGDLKKIVDWSASPFYAEFQAFEIQGCMIPGKNVSELHHCYEENAGAWFGANTLGKLTRTQEQDLMKIQYNFLVYDYCTDLVRFNGTRPKECDKNWPQVIY